MLENYLCADVTHFRVVGCSNTLEDIIIKILSAKPDLKRDEILRMIDERVRGADGFLTPESAALSLAADLGISFRVSFKHDLQIKDIVSGLSDVTVSGRVIYVHPLEKFLYSDGREGFRRSIYLADNTGFIKAILWNEAATLINEDLIDRVVRLSHVSVKRRGSGRLELSVGRRSRIEIDPGDLSEKDYPPITRFIKKVSEITGLDKHLSVIGLVERVYPQSTFKRQNGSEGRVRRVEVTDDAGKVSAVLWDSCANAISEEAVGRYIILLNMKVKVRFDGRVEIHSGDRTRIILLGRKPSGFK